MGQTKQIADLEIFLKNQLISNKQLFSEDIYNSIFQQAFKEFDGRKIIADIMFNYLKNEFPSLKDYFFAFYAEYMNRISKLSSAYTFEEFLNYSYNIYLEWQNVTDNFDNKNKEGESKEGEMQTANSMDLNKIEDIARSKGIPIRQEKNLPPIIDSTKNTKRIVIEKDDKRKFEKPNLRRVKTHGSSRIFDFDTFKEKVKGIDFNENAKR